MGTKGVKFTEEHKRKIGISHKGKHYMKMSEGQKGEKNHNWKGGITPLSKKIFQCFKYRQWRSDVFTKDNFTCQECNKNHLTIEAHHIKPFALILKENNIKTLEESLICEELWNINNGLTLCRECHKKTFNYKGRIKIV